MTNIAGCFMGKNNSKRLNVFVQANSSTYNLCMNNSRYYSLVYDDITWTNAGKYNYNIAYNIYVYAETNVQATMESNEDPTLIAVYTTTNTSMRTVHADVNSSYTAEVSGNTVRLTSLTADSVTYINFYDKQDLTGIQTLRPSILDLHQSFQNCRNLTGEPWCGPNVSNLFRTYENCINLTGSPVCSDLVVNMDSIWQCVSGLNRFQKPMALNAVVFGVRDYLIDSVRMRRGKWNNAYVIGGYPLISERERLIRQLGAREVFISTSKEECLRRLELDDSRDKAEWTRYIEEWWRRYSPRMAL
jgi:hypothetical protein